MNNLSPQMKEGKVVSIICPNCGNWRTVIEYEVLECEVCHDDIYDYPPMEEDVP